MNSGRHPINIYLYKLRHFIFLLFDIVTKLHIIIFPTININTWKNY